MFKGEGGIAGHEKVRLNTVGEEHKVKHYFQKRGWFNVETTLWFATDVVIPYVNEHLRSDPQEWILLIIDANGKVHIHPDVRKVFGDANILVWYGEPNMSHKIAPVDRGVGKTLRSVGIREGLEVWLEEKDNRKLWTRKRISAQMRRELSMEWLGDAWQQIFEDKYKKLRTSAWEATGSLISADGSDDHKIMPQGLANWPGPHPPGFAIPDDWLQSSEDEEEGEVEDVDDNEYETTDSEAE